MAIKKTRKIIKGWKQVYTADGEIRCLARVYVRGVIVKPLESATQIWCQKRHAYFSAPKYRASEMKVVSFQELDLHRRPTGKIQKSGVVIASYDWSKYRLGKWRKEPVDTNLNKACSVGLHFFRSKRAAQNYD